MSGNAKIVNSGYCQQHHCGELDLNEKCVICYIVDLKSKLSLAQTALEGAAKVKGLKVSRRMVSQTHPNLNAIKDIDNQLDEIEHTIATALKTLRGEQG